jgi:hypothetical protein
MRLTLPPCSPPSCSAASRTLPGWVSCVPCSRGEAGHRPGRRGGRLAGERVRAPGRDRAPGRAVPRLLLRLPIRRGVRVSTSQATIPAALGLGSPRWLRQARTARRLSWPSLASMAAEDAVAVTAAVLAGSVALLGFGLDSVIDALPSLIVVWRFTGIRTLSQSAERRAPRAESGRRHLLPARGLRRLRRRPRGPPRGPGHGQSSDACLMASSTMCATCSSVSEYSISRACRLAVTMREVRSTRRC